MTATLAYSSYFDRDYYENGELRGTAYSNYRESVKDSRDYRMIAEDLMSCFAPRRVLEVGCGMGQIGRHFEELGAEYVGIEVSDYCVAHKLCRTLLKADETGIPFPDGYFDLVFSCHALEHFPTAILRGCIRDQARVTGSIYGHYLPMVGTYPYFSEQALQKDPTHFQLHSRETWIEIIQTVCPELAQIDMCLPIDNLELFFGQIWFSKDGQFTPGFAHVRRYQDLCGNLFRTAAEARYWAGCAAADAAHLAFDPRAWRGTITGSIDWTGIQFQTNRRYQTTDRLALATQGVTGECKFRIALLGNDGFECEYWIKANADELRIVKNSDFTIRFDSPERRIDRVDIGGPLISSDMNVILSAFPAD